MFEYLELKIIAFWGTDVDVEIWVDGDNVYYKKRLWKPVDINVSKVSAMSIAEISEKFKALGISNWKKRYVPEDRFILDGEQWRVKYKDSYRKRKKVIEGDNEYPENWNEFLAVIKEIVGDIGVDDEGE